MCAKSASGNGTYRYSLLESKFSYSCLGLNEDENFQAPIVITHAKNDGAYAQSVWCSGDINNPELDGLAKGYESYWESLGYQYEAISSDDIAGIYYDNILKVKTHLVDIEYSDFDLYMWLCDFEILIDFYDQAPMIEILEEMARSKRISVKEAVEVFYRMLWLGLIEINMEVPLDIQSCAEKLEVVVNKMDA